MTVAVTLSWSGQKQCACRGSVAQLCCVSALPTNVSTWPSFCASRHGHGRENGVFSFFVWEASPIWGVCELVHDLLWLLETEYLASVIRASSRRAETWYAVHILMCLHSSSRGPDSAAQVVTVSVEVIRAKRKGSKMCLCVTFSRCKAKNTPVVMHCTNFGTGLMLSQQK